MRTPVGTVGLPTPPVTSILLIRHGDRYDYAIGKEPWKLRCKASDTLVSSDPPLSALGHSQARALASYLGSTGRRVDRIICSPYLRALQTAQPLAHESGLPLLVDFVAAEAHQKPSALPPMDARLPYFPEIDDVHAPLMQSVVTDGAHGMEPGVEPRLESQHGHQSAWPQLAPPKPPTPPRPPKPPKRPFIAPEARQPACSGHPLGPRGEPSSHGCGEMHCRLIAMRCLCRVRSTCGACFCSPRCFAPTPPVWASA